VSGFLSFLVQLLQELFSMVVRAVVSAISEG